MTKLDFKKEWQERIADWKKGFADCDAFIKFCEEADKNGIKVKTPHHTIERKNYLEGCIAAAELLLLELEVNHYFKDDEVDE